MSGRQVCPVIIKLTEAESIDDYRTESGCGKFALHFVLLSFLHLHILSVKKWFHGMKDMGSEMFELVHTSHYFVFRLVPFFAF